MKLNILFGFLEYQVLSSAWNVLFHNLKKKCLSSNRVAFSAFFPLIIMDMLKNPNNKNRIQIFK